MKILQSSQIESIEITVLDTPEIEEIILSNYPPGYTDKDTNLTFTLVMGANSAAADSFAWRVRSNSVLLKDDTVTSLTYSYFFADYGTYQFEGTSYPINLPVLALSTS